MTRDVQYQVPSGFTAAEERFDSNRDLESALDKAHRSGYFDNSLFESADVEVAVVAMQRSNAATDNLFAAIAKLK